MFGNSSQNNLVIARRKERSAVLFTILMLLTSYSAIEFATWEAMGSTDADGDGLPYGLEYYINTQPQDWDSDGDGLPDGWGNGSMDSTHFQLPESMAQPEILMETH